MLISTALAVCFCFFALRQGDDPTAGIVMFCISSICMFFVVLIGGSVTISNVRSLIDEIETAKGIAQKDFTSINQCMDQFTRVDMSKCFYSFNKIDDITSELLIKLAQILCLGIGIHILVFCIGFWS